MGKADFHMHTSLNDGTATVREVLNYVRDRTDLLFETFVKSNRLALMWGMPFGVGLALFAADLIDFVIGRLLFAVQ